MNSTARAAAVATSSARGSALPDVLRRGHDDPPRDELRVLAALQHHREVVHRRVRVAAAHRLDERGDGVVVGVAVPVVDDRAAAGRLLDILERDGAAIRDAGGRGLQQVEGVAGVAPGTEKERVARVGRDRDAARQPGRVGERPVDERAEVLRREGLERQHPHARHERRVDLVVGVLGGGADERHQAVLDRGQQRVLLGLVEAVDLVEEEHRPPARCEPVPCPRHHRPHVGQAGRHRRELLERRLGRAGHDAGERRLAGSRGAVEDHRRHAVALDGLAEERVGSEQGRLSDHLVQGRRAHAGGKGARRAEPVLHEAREQIVVLRWVAPGHQPPRPSGGEECGDGAGRERERGEHPERGLGAGAVRDRVDRRQPRGRRADGAESQHPCGSEGEPVRHVLLSHRHGRRERCHEDEPRR